MKLSSPKLKKTCDISEGNLQSLKIKSFFFITFQTLAQKKMVSYTFPYKEPKLSKLKYFPIVIVKCFFSFYNIIFYTQPVYVFYLLRDFCNVHDHIAASFLFLL